MNPPVLSQEGALTEGLPMRTAFRGPSFCVGSPMLTQWCDLGEDSASFIASIGLLSSVDLMVLGQG